MNQIPVNFTVDRATWRCGGRRFAHKDNGHGTGLTKLLNQDGFMCCLGHIALQLIGDDDDDHVELLDSCEMPDDIPIDDLPPLVRTFSTAGVLCKTNTEFSKKAARINDDTDIPSRYARERKLERLAEEFGLRIEFVGKYTDEE